MSATRSAMQANPRLMPFLCSLPSSSLPFLVQPLRPPNPPSHYRHLNGTGGRMLGLWLAPSRCGGRLRLVAMELRGMVWIGLVNSGCSRKEGDLVLSTLNG